MTRPEPRTPPASAPPSPATGRRRVLLIDDEESLRYAVSKGLARAGFEVVAAETGRAGVDRLREGGFDAIVTDVRLPDLSGLDVVAVATELDPEVPVFVITGFGSVDTALEAMRRGARDFVTKPFEIADLVRLLERELAERGASRDARSLRARVERQFAPDRYAAVEDELKRGSAGAGADAAHEIAEAPAADADGPLGLRDAQRRFEIRYVEDLLARTGGNVAGASRLAGISRPNFHKKLKTLGVDPERFKQAHRRGRSAGL